VTFIYLSKLFKCHSSACYSDECLGAFLLPLFIELQDGKNRLTPCHRLGT